MWEANFYNKNGVNKRKNRTGGVGVGRKPARGDGKGKGMGISQSLRHY
jgi:hypothetical protein